MYPLNSFLLELLVDHRWISHALAIEIRDGIDASVSAAQQEFERYRKVLELGVVEESLLLEFLAENEGIRWASSACDCIPDDSDLELLRAVLAGVEARTYRVAPVGFCKSGNGVVLATCYPCSYDDLEVLAHLMNREVEVLLVPESVLLISLEKLYGADRMSEQSREPTQVVEEIGSFGAWMDRARPNLNNCNENTVGSVSNYVDWVVAEAIKRRASDIHFEPMESRLLIRCRVDGVLQQLDCPPHHHQDSILSRLKLMARIDIAEKRLPQDGRFHLVIEQKDYDFRVSTLPSTHGESVVIRILDKETLNIGLSELGMLDSHQETFGRVISAPDGIFLVTGPTGSGKSTSLYAALNHINDPSAKIITVEDPVEYYIKGINQVQVRNEVHMTFSAALRSMLRQAPNIIMIGEIRDRETAEIAIHASLTGHAVFSTLHTNDAPSAVTRLIDMDVKPFLVSAALRAVMAQRLVRRIPEHARLCYAIADWQVDALGPDYASIRGQQFFHAGATRQSFHGRVGVFEMFEVTDAMEAVIYNNPTLSAVRDQLALQGFKNMRYDGVQKALKGWTSIEEVLSVTPADEIMKHLNR